MKLHNFFRIALQKIFSISSFVFLGAVFTSCSVLCLYLVPKQEIDISYEPQYAYLFNNFFEFKTDVFLYKLADELDSPKLNIGVPQIASHLPYSIADYENDPKNWMNTDGYTKEGIGTTPGLLVRSKVFGIIRAGTQFSINRLVNVKLPSGIEFNTIYISVHDVKFQDCLIDGGDIFRHYGKCANTLDESYVFSVE